VSTSLHDPETVQPISEGGPGPAADVPLSPDARGSRLGREFRDVDRQLINRNIHSTVIVFGSARAPSPEQMAAPGVNGARDERHARMQAALSSFYEKARVFARLVSERGGALAPEGAPRHNVIATGGGPGIMEAANRGAREAGAPTIGFNIILPAQQQPNRFATPELTFRFHYFATRKMHLAMRAQALAVFPGGFGTLDELFEILTLQQTRKAPPAPVVLIGRAHWPRIIGFEALVEEGLIERDDLNLFEIVDEPEEAWESLVRRGLRLPPNA
jgi:uncharacterized protein (TIGR00730 family)